MGSSHGSLARLLAVFVLVPSMVLCQTAQPGPSTQPLDRHARKIQKTLASFPDGSTVFVQMNDGSQRLGSLGALSSASFELIQRTGDKLTVAYADVQRVQKADTASANSITFRHHHGLVVGLIAAGCLIGFLIFAVVELKKS